MSTGGMFGSIGLHAHLLGVPKACGKVPTLCKKEEATIVLGGSGRLSSLVLACLLWLSGTMNDRLLHVSPLLESLQEWSLH
jgi:hypothetical protein